MKTEIPKEVPLQQRQALAELLRRLQVRYPGQIIASVLYGSVARGDFRADSDIDVLLVAKEVTADFKWEVRGLASRVSYEFDVIFNLHIYSQANWELQRTRQNTVWRNVEREGVALSLPTAS